MFSSPESTGGPAQPPAACLLPPRRHALRLPAPRQGQAQPRPHHGPRRPRLVLLQQQRVDATARAVRESPECWWVSDPPPPPPGLPELTGAPIYLSELLAGTILWWVGGPSWGGGVRQALPYSPGGSRCPGGPPANRSTPCAEGCAIRVGDGGGGQCKEGVRLWGPLTAGGLDMDVRLYGRVLILLPPLQCD